MKEDGYYWYWRWLHDGNISGEPEVVQVQDGIVYFSGDEEDLDVDKCRGRWGNKIEPPKEAT
jgi:hypothetical protein